jgi:hypothetical protein
MADGTLLMSGYHVVLGNPQVNGPNSTYRGHLIVSTDGGRSALDFGLNIVFEDAIGLYNNLDYTTTWIIRLTESRVDEGIHGSGTHRHAIGSYACCGGVASVCVIQTTPCLPGARALTMLRYYLLPRCHCRQQLVCAKHCQRPRH